jgi:hypothetical protein
MSVLYPEDGDNKPSIFLKILLTMTGNEKVQKWNAV